MQLIRRARGAFRRLNVEDLAPFELLAVTEAAAQMLDALDAAEYEIEMRRLTLAAEKMRSGDHGRTIT